MVLFRRTLVVGDTAVTISFKGKFDKTATLAIYRNVNPSNPIGATSTSSASPGTTVTTPSITTTVAGERLILISGANGTSGTWTPPAGMDQQIQHTSSSTDSAIADQTLTTTGATGDRTSTHGTSTELVGALIALKPVSTTYSYDSRGNRTAITSSGTTTLVYDQADRLKSYGASATYTYDGDGLRTSKTVSGTTTDFAWDTSQALQLLLAENSTRYVYGPGGLPLARIDSGGGVFYYHQDQLGSVRALTDSAGTVVATYSYDPYGKISGSTGTATTPLRYAGQYTDSESGYQYLRARYYDPTTGQFLTRDPLVDVTGEPYAYAGNNPLNYADPTGLYWGEGLVEDAVEIVDDAWDATGGRAVSAVDDISGQDVANFAGGTLNTVTFGNERRINRWLGQEGKVDRCSGWYTAGEIAGLAVPAGGVGSAWKAGREIRIGSNLRIAPFGNRTGHHLGRWPHYHRRGIDPATGLTRPGQGIDRHRPWETKGIDTSFWNRF